jgi:hypothetical protein
MIVILKTITITEKELEIIEKYSLNCSAFVRKALRDFDKQFSEKMFVGPNVKSTHKLASEEADSDVY